MSPEQIILALVGGMIGAMIVLLPGISLLLILIHIQDRKKK